MAKSCAECGLPIDFGGDFYTVRHGSNFKMGEERIFCSRDCLVKSLVEEHAKKATAEIDSLSLYHLPCKGTKPTFDDLPSSDNSVGDIWKVSDTGATYVWTTTGWFVLSDPEVTQPKTPHELIALIQNAIADVRAETRGLFDPLKDRFSIQVTESFAPLLDKNMCGMCTARDWLSREYGNVIISKTEDTSEFIVKVGTFVKEWMMDFVSMRKSFDNGSLKRCANANAMLKNMAKEGANDGSK